MTMGSARVLGRIARQEWRTLFAETTPWLIVAVLGLAIVYAVSSGRAWLAFERATLDRARAEQAQRYQGLKTQLVEIEEGRRPAPFADPRMPDMIGGRLAWTYAAMPPLPLLPLSIGQSDLLPYYFRVSTASREAVLSTSEIENPHRLLSGRFDLSFVIVYLFPLFIIALSYNVISLEMEEGTLALLLSQPISLRTLVAGKIGLRAALVAALVVVFSLVGLAVTGAAVDLGHIARLAAWAGVVAAYAAFWFGVVVLVVSFGRGSAGNALMLAGIWLVLVVVLPSTLNMAASTLYPMPSRVEMIAATRVASDEASQNGSQLLAKYYGDHPELAGAADMEKAMNDVAVTRLAIDDEIERRVRPVADRYGTQLALQQGLVDRLRFLSPAIVLQDALNDVAGTGAVRYRHFVSLVEDYHRRWRAFIASMVVNREKASVSTYDALPQFDYQDEPLDNVLARVGLAAVILLALAAAAGALGMARLTKFPTSL